MEESLKFYQEIVGLNLVRRFNAGPNTEIAFLGDGETKVELMCHKENKNKVNMGQDISLGFEVKTVDEKMAFVRDKGVAIHGGPFQPNPNIRFFYVMDPNGLRIQFVENI